MAELGKEAYGPAGDATRHLPAEDLERAIARLPAAPTDAGHLRMVLRRLPDGSRERPARVRLTPEQGVPGDGWTRRPPRNPEAQLAVIRSDVAEIVANGQSLDLFGDNLFVDLDVSATNLPAGTRLQVGAALVEVTPFPHNGCAKFSARFGLDALRCVQAAPTRPQNRRGIYWKVVEAGDAGVGNTIQVLTRGASNGG
jgi:MOSC domain-containing protein YiiM